jgi:hypothetical protein
LRPCAGHAALYAAALACVLFACSPLRAQEAKFEGQRVAEIRIVDESGKAVPRDMASFPLRVGDPFDIAKERDALRELYRKSPAYGSRPPARVPRAPQLLQ